MTATYDPMRPVDLAWWQALDEAEQGEAVTRYHRQAGVEVPNMLLHATIHTIVENQVALGETIPVNATLRRLQQEGLDRHEAVHAVGGILAVYMNDLIHDPSRPGDLNVEYFEKLQALTASGWRAQFA